jgi:hypothetical protein
MNFSQFTVCTWGCELGERRGYFAVTVPEEQGKFSTILAADVLGKAEIIRNSITGVARSESGEAHIFVRSIQVARYVVIRGNHLEGGTITVMII